MILVTGACGQLAGLVLNRLAVADTAAGPRPAVVAGTRDPEALTTAPGDAVVRRIDFDDPDSLIAGFAGVTVALLVSAGYAESDVVIARHGAAIAAAESAGVRHLVYTSVTTAGDHLTYAVPHRWTERRLAAGATTWTVLRNGLYAELLVPDTAQAVATGTVSAPLADGAIALVGRQDLASVAARVLLETAADLTADRPPRHAGQVYDLVGTAAIGGRELAELAAGSTGSPIAFRPRRLADLRADLTASGLPGWQVENIVSTYAVASAGFLADTGGPGTRSALADLLGTTPRSAADLIAAAIG